MFHGLATRGETLFQQQILRLGSKKMVLNQVKNIFASRTQILPPKHMFPRVATEAETILLVFSCLTLVLPPTKHYRKHCLCTEQCLV